MKRLFVLLLAANLALGAWLLLGDPVDMVREPERMALQIDPGRFHVLSDADAARLRTQADAASAAAAATAPAPGSAPDDASKAGGDTPAKDKAGADSPDAAKSDATSPDAPRADRAAGDGARAEPAAAAPSPGCIELGDFASESAARKARARLAEIGPEEHLSLSTSDKSTRLRMTGVDAALELKIQRVLKDFPRQRLTHCSDPAAAR